MPEVSSQGSLKFALAAAITVLKTSRPTLCRRAHTHHCCSGSRTRRHPKISLTTRWPARAPAAMSLTAAQVRATYADLRDEVR